MFLKRTSVLLSGKLKRIRFENVRVDCVGARVVMLS